MENIPCKHLEHWSENQSPLGSGLNWPMEFEDCGHPGFEDTEKQYAFEVYVENNDCSPQCPGYEPVKVAICKKHGEFLEAAGCDGCMYDSYIECEQAAKEYFANK